MKKKQTRAECLCVTKIFRSWHFWQFGSHSLLINRHVGELLVSKSPHLLTICLLQLFVLGGQSRDDSVSGPTRMRTQFCWKCCRYSGARVSVPHHRSDSEGELEWSLKNSGTRGNYSTTLGRFSRGLSSRSCSSKSRGATWETMRFASELQEVSQFPTQFWQGFWCWCGARRRSFLVIQWRQSPTCRRLGRAIKKRIVTLLGKWTHNLATGDIQTRRGAYRTHFNDKTENNEMFLILLRSQLSLFFAVSVTDDNKKSRIDVESEQLAVAAEGILEAKKRGLENRLYQGSFKASWIFKHATRWTVVHFPNRRWRRHHTNAKSATTSEKGVRVESVTCLSQLVMFSKWSKFVLEFIRC